MRVRDLNWMQLESYLEGDDRIVLPLGSTEQHAQLSLETDNILAERVSVEAAQPLGVPVLPVLAYGITPLFAAYPGSPTLSAETYLRVVRELLDSLYGQGFRRVLIVNGHGGNVPARQAASEWMAAREDAQAIFHDWWIGPDVAEVIQEIEPAAHASWMENFPWTRLEGVEPPAEPKAPLELSGMRGRGPRALRELLGDGSFGGPTGARTRRCCASGTRAWPRCGHCSSRAGRSDRDQVRSFRRGGFRLPRHVAEDLAGRADARGVPASRIDSEGVPPARLPGRRALGDGLCSRLPRHRKRPIPRLRLRRPTRVEAAWDRYRPLPRHLGGCSRSGEGGATAGGDG